MSCRGAGCAELPVRIDVQPQRCRQALTHGRHFCPDRFISNRRVRDSGSVAALYVPANPIGRELMNSNSKIALAVVVGAALGGATIHGLHAQAKPKAYSITETE